MDIINYSRTELTPEQLAEHDRVYGELAAAVRELGDAQLRTQLPLDEAAEITGQVRELTGRLRRRARAGWFGIELDHEGGGREHGNAVLGLRNPFACALGEHSMFWEQDGARATLELGPVYEGPPGCVHGGVIALVLDQLFTEAAAAAGQIGMTATLTLTYRRPTPLGTVHVDARLVEVDGAKRTLRATCTDAAGNLTAEADALLILPKWISDTTLWPKRPPATPPPALHTETQQTS